ncbi:MAG: TlpA family protein disulfide reductase [Alicyclobacillus macrosporangiidus]|nr:TlpA family protein disulfide reductase [Alicyclobacillus macrosporangiidus]
MRGMRPRAFVALCAGMIVLTGFAYLAIRMASSQPQPVQPGEVAPDIQGKTWSGADFSLRALRGKPVLLDFFTTWCPPCLDETPDLMAFAAAHRGEIRVVLVDRGEARAAVASYVARFHVPDNVTVVLDTENRWSAPYGVTGQPEAFFIAADGRVVQHTLGPLSQVQMEAGAKAAGK